MMFQPYIPGIIQIKISQIFSSNENFRIPAYHCISCKAFPRIQCDQIDFFVGFQIDAYYITILTYQMIANSMQSVACKE